jgi:hypothetical protein
MDPPEGRGTRPAGVEPHGSARAIVRAEWDAGQARLLVREKSSASTTSAEARVRAGSGTGSLESHLTTRE